MAATPSTGQAVQQGQQASRGGANVIEVADFIPVQQVPSMPPEEEVARPQLEWLTLRSIGSAMAVAGRDIISGIIEERFNVCICVMIVNIWRNLITIRYVMIVTIVTLQIAWPWHWH